MAEATRSRLSVIDAEAAGRAPGRAAAPGVRRISILGATGSIGASTLDLIRRNRDAFRLVAMTAQSNVEALADVAIEMRAEIAVIGDEALHQRLKERLAGTGIEAAAGDAAIVEAAERPADCVMAAIVGAAGMKPTFAAVRQGRRVALANKECLVSAGPVFMRAVARSGAELIPVDSEHSGALQSIDPAAREHIERIVLTASGGPFRTWALSRMATAKPEEALRHPNWSMGRKISVDSATLMNKTLEFIEAHYLFGLGIEKLGVIVHPQSIVHCLVEYADGSVIAQLACPDMRTPIALSLAWPRRMPAPTERLDLVRIASLTFEAPDETRFPALGLGRQVLERGGTAPAILNAANEIAVEAFLVGRIGFLDIARLTADALDVAEQKGIIAEPAAVADVLTADDEGRRMARDLLSSFP